MKQKSFFFPLALIVAGITWLLISLGKIPVENLWALSHFWPVLLIAGGLSLILQSYWPSIRIALDVPVVGAAMAAIVFASQLGWSSPKIFMLGFSNFGGGMQGSGKVVSEVRQLSGVSDISIAYPAEVKILQGGIERIEILAEDNLLPQLSSEVQDGNLVIHNQIAEWNKRVNPTKPVRINITIKSLDNLNVSSAGSVNIEKLKTPSLTVNLSGTGSVTIAQLDSINLECDLSGAGSLTAAGTTNDLNLEISGVGSFQGGKLQTKTAQAHISGTASATLFPSERLIADISGTGSIYYHGNPTIDQHVSGMGSVKKLDK